MQSDDRRHWIVNDISYVNRHTALDICEMIFEVKFHKEKSPEEYHDTAYKYTSYEIEVESFLDYLKDEVYNKQDDDELQWDDIQLKEHYTFREALQELWKYLDRFFEEYDDRLAGDTLWDYWEKL